MHGVAHTARDEGAKHYILRAVLESPPNIVIFALDRAYRYLAFNEAHRRTMKGIWDVDIAVGQNMLEEVIGRDDDRAKAKKNFDRALAGEHFVVIEEYGEERYNRRYYEDVYSPIVAANGEVIGLTLFLTDITEQKRAQDQLDEYRLRLEQLVDERTAALKRSEALYRTLVENAPIAAMVHRDGKLLYVNPAAVVLSGDRAADQLSTRPLADLLGPEAAHAVSTENVIRKELTLQRRDGSVADVEWTSLPVEFEREPATLSLAIDVSERKKIDAERRRLEEQMLHTQKLESLGLLAGGIAHDFNNLLVGILGNVDFALRTTGLPEDHRALLHRIKTAAVRASELTSQMLAYSGKGPFVLRPLDLSRIASEMADLMNVSVPKNARLVLDLTPDPPAFEGDGTQIRQVLMNLITNAADAVGDAGGTITLRTSVITATRSLLSSAFVDDSLPPGRYVCLEVSDDGVGMDESTRARLFDPFFTTKAKGRGLGLAAVLGIVRAHHGAIAVASEPQKGSRFTVLLPCSDRPAIAEVAPMDTETWRASGTVLIADDEPRVRLVLAMMLTDIGFRVLEAESAQSCLERYRQNAAAINAVVVDLMMPGGGGREVVRVLRAEGHRVPVVVSSGYSEEAIGPELRSDPQIVFLEKPFEFATLVRTLRAAIEAA